MVRTEATILLSETMRSGYDVFLYIRRPSLGACHNNAQLFRWGATTFSPLNPIQLLLPLDVSMFVKEIPENTVRIFDLCSETPRKS